MSNLQTQTDRLNDAGIETSEIKFKWNALTSFFLDPAGHRIEVWQPLECVSSCQCNLYSSVPDWVIEHSSLLTSFQELAIDYCCGAKSLHTVCLEMNLKPSEVIQQIQQQLRRP